MARQAVVVVLLVLALRLPFLNQAVQGDDFYYLKGAEHAQIDPLHPNHARYIFQGEMVDMRGHPHPPLNSWFLGTLLAVKHSERESVYHAAYVLWSLAAALGMLVVARRFVPDRALAATVLFTVTLPFVVNGTSLEADLPLLGCWMAAVALFVTAVDRGSPAFATAAFVAGALAGLTAYQAVALTFILVVYLWTHRRNWIPGWMALLGVPAAIVAYQLFERLSSGAVPAAMLAGYMQAHGLQEATRKAKNAAALVGHAGWIVFPALAMVAFRRLPQLAWVVPGLVAIAAAFADPNPLFWVSAAVGALMLTFCTAKLREAGDMRFLSAWVLLFFAAALVMFFAGAARYLLPVSAPVAILVSRELRARWLIAGAAANAVVALGLAVVNYQHWGGYRDFARSLQGETQSRRTWVNGEWGLRQYLQEEGALPVERDRPPRDGDVVVSTAYTNPLQVRLTPIATHEITSPIPLRIVALGAKSGYSSIAFGLRPFDISLAPMDIVRAEAVSLRQPVLSRVTIGTPEALDQILSGVYNNDRWMGERAVVALKRLPGTRRISAVLFIPEASPARTFSLSANGVLLSRQTFARPGRYTLSAVAPTGEGATISVSADRTFTAPPDTRALSALLLEVGFE